MAADAGVTASRSWNGTAPGQSHSGGPAPSTPEYTGTPSRACRIAGASSSPQVKRPDPRWYSSAQARDRAGDGDRAIADVVDGVAEPGQVSVVGRLEEVGEPHVRPHAGPRPSREVDRGRLAPPAVPQRRDAPAADAALGRIDDALDERDGHGSVGGVAARLEDRRALVDREWVPGGQRPTSVRGHRVERILSTRWPPDPGSDPE